MKDLPFARHHHPPKNLLDRALRKLLFQQIATVQHIESLADCFRLITLQAQRFKTSTFQPGDKLQIAFGGTTSRTYTPFDLDSNTGTLRLLGHIHGDTPASRWLEELRAGDRCDVFGPSRSITFPTTGHPLLFVGDETSFGLARAARKTNPETIDYLFEVDSIPKARRVLEQLGIERPYLVERQADDGHRPALLMHFEHLITHTNPRHYVLTGKGITLKHLVRSLKQHGVDSRNKQVKAYWLPGKSGLD